MTVGSFFGAVCDELPNPVGVAGLTRLGGAVVVVVVGEAQALPRFDEGGEEFRVMRVRDGHVPAGSVILRVFCGSEENKRIY